MAQKRWEAKQKTLARVRKKFGPEVFVQFSGGEAPVEECLSTGHQHLDDILSGVTDKGLSIYGTGKGLPFGRIVEIYGPEGQGKAQPIDEPILTPLGFIPMGDLRVGMSVIGSNGKPTKVLGVFPQGNRPVFEVCMSDGTFTRTCAEHLWQTTRDDDPVPKVRSLAEIAETLTRKNTGAKASSTGVYHRHRVPCVAAVEWDTHPELPLDPYVLGALLGDGSFYKNSVRLHKPEIDVQERVAALLPIGDEAHREPQQRFITFHKVGKGVADTAKIIQSLGLGKSTSCDKFIPRDYLFASVEERIKLLQGLCDTDGHVVYTGTRIEFSTSSPQLHEDIVFLSRSLGGVIRVTTRTPTYTYKGEKKNGRLAYRIYMHFPSGLCPVSSVKHLKRWLGPTAPCFRRIVAVEPAGEAECVCIKVAAKDQLYVTDDFLVTHNTTLALFILARAQRAGYEVAFIDAEHSLHLQYAQTMGVDIDKLLYNQPDGAEDVFNLIREFARDGVVRVVVVDSSAALEPAADLEADIGDAQVARQARLMSQALKRLVGDVKRGKLLVIFISQVRAKIGAVAFGPQTQATGGKALKFFASIRLEMYNKGQIKAKGGRRLGTRCGIKCVKNKVAPPFREVFADNVFGKGFVNVYPGDEALMGKEEKSEEEA